MRKSERLDQILIRLGYVTAAEVEDAVRRQRDAGGRLGQNLVELGALTEEQLFDGLVEQFRIPTVSVDESSIDRSLLDRMPVDVLATGLVVPIAWNEALGVLSVAVANPSDEDGLARVRDAFGARKVRVSLAPEGVLAELVSRLGVAETGAQGEQVRLVALPELFEPPNDEGGPADGLAEEPDRRVVMLTAGAVRRNFLPAVLRAEGVELVVVAEVGGLGEALAAGADTLLVDEQEVVRFREWRAGPDAVPVDAEVIVFASLSDALVDTPVPYAEMAGALRSAVHAIAESRAFAEGVSAPYTRMATELDVLAERLKLGRVASDGLHIGLHLLLPVEAGTRIEPFRNFTASIELAHRLRFPWPVDRLLGTCMGLYLGRTDPAGENGDEVARAAQLLALVWFRHNLAEQATAIEPPGMAAPEDDDERGRLRTTLRSLAGRLATLHAVEAYLDLLDERDGGVPTPPSEVLLVGGDRVARALEPALQRVGCGTTVVPDGAAAQAQLAERAADAIVVDHASVGGQLEQVCRILRADRRTLVFVLSDEPDPALVLNLLDLGIDDVFGPPHEFDLMSARIQRAIRSRAQAPVATPPEGQFSAHFEAFSFLDLAQMLANGLKTVRVDLRRGTSAETGVLHFAKGRPVHATCGDLSGPAAVYYVISWEDDGEFVVDDADSLPDRNIEESMEALLMEGVRLLDESRA